MTDTIRIAIIGTGIIAHSHAKAIAQLPHARLEAICDTDADKGRAFAQQYGVRRVYRDYGELLKQADIELVHICLPSGLHAPYTIAAAQAGKHILCEKPIAITGDSMTAMIAETRARDVKFGAVYQRRTLPEAIAARELVRRGGLGRMVLGDACLKYHRSPEYYRSAGWRGTWAMDGGGALMNQGIHGIDLIQWIMGDIESVYARSAALVRDIEVEDTAVAVVKYKSGAFGVLQGATSVYPSQESRFELHGNDGSIVLSDAGILQWAVRGEEAPPARRDDGAKGLDFIVNHGHLALIDDMLTAIREDRDPLVTGEEARKAVDIILAIYASAREGREIAV